MVQGNGWDGAEAACLIRVPFSCHIVPTRGRPPRATPPFCEGVGGRKQMLIVQLRPLLSEEGADHPQIVLVGSRNVGGWAHWTCGRSWRLVRQEQVGADEG